MQLTVSSGGWRQPGRCLSHLVESPEGSGWPPASRLAPSDRLSPEWAGTMDSRQSGRRAEGKYVTKSLTEHLIFDMNINRGETRSEVTDQQNLHKLHLWMFQEVCDFTTIFCFRIWITHGIEKLFPLRNPNARKVTAFTPPGQQVLHSLLTFWQVYAKLTILFSTQRSSLCELETKTCTQKAFKRLLRGHHQFVSQTF